MTTAAVAYYRMSTDAQDESIPQQQGVMRPRAKLHDIDVVREFQDEGISGGRMAKRDAFKEMLAFCQERHRQGQPVEAVVCWDTKRFSRASSIETNAYLWQFMQAGVFRLFTHSDGWIDFRKEEQRVLFNLRQDISNNRDLRDRARDITRGKLACHAARWYNGGRVPYGFDRMVMDEHGNARERVERAGQITFKREDWHVTLVPCERPEELEVVRWLFDRFANTETSFRGLALTLNERGVPGPGSGSKRTPGPTRWGTTQVRELLLNPVYAGGYRYGHRLRGAYYRTVGGEIVEAEYEAPMKVVRDAPVHWDAYPALVDRTTWDRVQEKVARRRTGGERCRAKGCVLSGLLRCGHCGAKMQGHAKTNAGRRGRVVHVYYVCSGNKQEPGRCRDLSVREDRIVRVLVRKLQEDYLAPHRLGALTVALRERLQARQAAEPGRAEALERRLAALDADIRQGARNVLRATKNFDVIEEELAALRDRRDKIARELASLRATQAEAPADLADKIEKAVARLKTLGEHLHKAKPEQLRAVFRELISRVDLYFDVEGDRCRGQWYRFSRGVVKLRPQLELAGSVENATAIPAGGRYHREGRN
jgi:DNA invertase Pin-like site-specific DNA recombinase